MQVPIKKRNMLAQILLTIVTLGIYVLYWFYQVSMEMKNATNDTQASPALWVVLFFIPFGGIYSVYKFSELYENFSVEHFDKWLLFVLYIVFSPAVWFIVQTNLNKRADLQFAQAQ